MVDKPIIQLTRSIDNIGGGEEEFYPNFLGYKCIDNELNWTYESLYNFVLEVISNNKYYEYYRKFYYTKDNIVFFNELDSQVSPGINCDKCYFKLEADNYAFGAEEYTVYFNGLELKPNDNDDTNLFQEYGNGNFLFNIYKYNYINNAFGIFYGDSGDDGYSEFYYLPIYDGGSSTSVFDSKKYPFKASIDNPLHAPALLYIDKTSDKNFRISETSN